jgi:glutamine---fructose-6-phosphate transaminase (isomerizing)
VRASNQSFMHEEAGESAAVAERQLAELAHDMGLLGQRLRAMDPPLVVTCARGSSDHAATFAKYLIETRVRTPVASFAPSTSSLYATPWRHLDRALFLAISQSGRSPDILLSARAARQAGACVIALVNDPASPLAEVAELTIPLLAGTERSVAATKSFIASLVVIVNLVASWTEEEDLRRAVAGAPRVLRSAWELDWSPAVAALSVESGLFVIGRGLTLGIAQEAALKLKETCGLHAEAFSAAEVRHGPMALVGPGFPVVMFPPCDEGAEDFEALAREFSGRGARVILAAGERHPAGGSEDPHDDELRAHGSEHPSHGSEHRLHGREQPSHSREQPAHGSKHRLHRREESALLLPALPGLDHPVLAALATIQSFYRLAASLSVARGFDPDRPPHLQKVTETR